MSQAYNSTLDPEVQNNHSSHSKSVSKRSQNLKSKTTQNISYITIRHDIRVQTFLLINGE